MIFVDTEIFLYAAGRDSDRREACQGVLGRLVEEEPGLVARTDANVLREALEHCRDAGAPQKGQALFDSITSLGIPVLGVEEEDLRQARLLMASIPELATRAAVHAGVMRSHGIGRVLSYDESFDFLPGIERLEPWVPEDDDTK
jgi:predicted nucleic acid-binding protein